MVSWWIRFMSLTVALLFAIFMAISVEAIGVNYGRNADNLPPPSQVIALCKKCGIQSFRLFDPSHDILEALRGSNLKVSIGVKNEDIQTLASNPSAANQWVSTNVAPYADDVNIQWITIGNEVIPGVEATLVTQAMQNIYNAKSSILGPTDSIKVTTVMSMAGLRNGYPPSNGVFSDEIVEVMRHVSSFLAQTGSPLLINAYPYMAYASDPQHISFEYATFQAPSPIIDGNLKYFSLFEAMVDVVNAAMEKIGFGNVPILVAETGWPTKGNEPFTSIENAQTYNQKLLSFVQSGKGSPRKPTQPVDAFIFAMFNEDKKEGIVEQNWGIFNPDMSPIYPLFPC
ncbi:glucan endo-1,3-beta-glucosidase-like [Neltuma alba]|uniref:glucan endo-1,3-beta-glucosidase-like n=1 Tax=Neltuma alba TaxID=207710 RepID=UPI0010A3DA13|nr:glucan endo-1,3-beta-glucosidase-like [Prosopis alba]